MKRWTTAAEVLERARREHEGDGPPVPLGGSSARLDRPPAAEPHKPRSGGR